MKAARIYTYGSPDVFKVEDIARPTVRPNDVLIEVHASSVNPIDYKIRQGGQRGGIRYTMPVVLGMDVSGVVLEVGSQVKRFKVGDEVYSSPTHQRQGTYAEYVAVDADAVALKPKNITHAEAASIPLVGLTVWESLVYKRQLKAGEKVFVQAGSGGVGTFAIQFAKAMGAYVATSCSTRNVELVTELGADEVIDYTQQDFDAVLRDYDHVIEALGQPYLDRSLALLKRGGHIASLNAGLPKNTEKWGPLLGLLLTGWNIVAFKLRSRLFHGVQTSQILRQTKGEFLEQITRHIEEGSIRAVIDRSFPLAEIAEAHRYIETGRARGKIVITMPIAE